MSTSQQPTPPPAGAAVCKRCGGPLEYGIWSEDPTACDWCYFADLGLIGRRGDEPSKKRPGQ